MPHYYSEHQDAPFDIIPVTLRINNQEITFSSAPGVFSKNKIDKGTLLLASVMQIEKGSAVLDIGCGIGVLGIVAAEQGAQPTFSDVNHRALALAKANLKKHNIQAKVVHSSLYEKIKDKFDVILSNPPQSAGKKVCFDLIAGAFDHLNPNGSLQLVARHNKGGSSLQKHMEEVFGTTEVLVKKGGYWVYKAVKKR